MRVLQIALLLLLQLPQAAEQPASITGRSTRRGTNDGVARTQVVLAKVGGTFADYQTTLTDDNGTFSFRELKPGEYRLYAERDGYVTAEYSRRTSNVAVGPWVGRQGDSIRLAGGEDLRSIVIALVPTAVIAGRVVDSDGNPLRNFWVDALRPSYENGVRTFSPLKSAQTDDRGEYRLFDLIPGRYFVAVSPPSRPRIENDVYFVPAAPMMRPNSRHQFERNTPGAAAISQGIVEASAFSNDLYLPTFYPGTLVASAAAPVVLSEGMSMRLDLSTARQHTVRIRGKVLNGATNTPVEKPKVYLTPDDGFDSSLIESRWNGAEGTFEFEGVAAGVYELYGYGSGLRVRMPLNVGERDIDNLVVALKPGITVKARVSIEGAADNSVPLGGIGGALRPGFLFNASPDGQFTLDDLAEGPYRLSLTLPEQLAGYYIKSARLGSIEVLNGPLDINSAVDGAIQVVLARNGATLDATVLDAEQVPLAGASVVVVPQPALRQRWDLYRAAVTGSSGRVHIEGIAPGDYSVFSWESIGRNAWQDPNVIRAVEGQATPVRFDEGGARNLTLKAIPVSR